MTCLRPNYKFPDPPIDDKENKELKSLRCSSSSQSSAEERRKSIFGTNPYDPVTQKDEYEEWEFFSDPENVAAIEKLYHLMNTNLPNSSDPNNAGVGLLSWRMNWMYKDE